MRAFESETGIGEAVWRGVYWVRWSEAVKEAGLEPNVKVEKYTEEFLLTKLAEAARHFGKFPTAMEFRMYRRIDQTFPNVKSITRHFDSLMNIPPRLAEWAEARSSYSDVAAALGTFKEESEPSEAPTREGLVYLLKWGAHYKIGRSDQIERRIKKLSTELPEKGELLHTIRTDDPPGIEAYWHQRFADRRANGEWFKLTRTDIAAFKRRKFQ